MAFLTSLRKLRPAVMCTASVADLNCSGKQAVAYGLSSGAFWDSGGGGQLFEFSSVGGGGRLFRFGIVVSSDIRTGSTGIDFAIEPVPPVCYFIPLFRDGWRPDRSRCTHAGHARPQRSPPPRPGRHAAPGHRRGRQLGLTGVAHGARCAGPELLIKPLISAHLDD